VNTTTLPRIAAESDLGWGVRYAAESTMVTQPDEHLVVWLPRPQIPPGAETTYRWVENDTHIGTQHVTLDEISMAKLLYIADAEPLELNDAEALTAIHYSLSEVHCNMLRCSALVSNNFDGPRWRCCEQRAALLVGTGA